MVKSQPYQGSFQNNYPKCNRNNHCFEISVSSRLTAARKKVALDHIAYENEARGVKSLKIQTFSRCNEGTIVDRAVKNPNRAGCNVIETVGVYKF